MSGSVVKAGEFHRRRVGHHRLLMTRLGGSSTKHSKHQHQHQHQPQYCHYHNQPQRPDQSQSIIRCSCNSTTAVARRQRCNMAISVTSEDEDEYISDSQSTGGSSDPDDDEDDEWPPQPPSQNFFAPPFYGRPPTPLPPSPSLTSLLRPSRPTTPDASDDDAVAPVHPRAAPTVPTHEYYGFVLYLFSGLTFLTYLLWSYLPAPFLHALGIRYYPNRWWALAVPAFLVMGLVYTYVALAAYNTEVMTAPLSSVDTIVDGAGKVAVVDSKGRLRYGAVDGDRELNAAAAARSAAGMTNETGTYRDRESKRDKDGRLRWREIWSEGTDAVLDIPLGGVCEVLYGEGRHA